MFQMPQDERDESKGIKPIVHYLACQEASFIVKHKCNSLGVSLRKLQFTSCGTYVILFFILFY